MWFLMSSSFKGLYNTKILFKKIGRKKWLKKDMNCTLYTFSLFSVVNTASKISFCTSSPERKCTALKALQAMSKTEKKVLYYWIIHNWFEVTEKNSFLCGFSILLWTDLVFLDKSCIMEGTPQTYICRLYCKLSIMAGIHEAACVQRMAMGLCGTASKAGHPSVWDTEVFCFVPTHASVIRTIIATSWKCKFKKKFKIETSTLQFIK